MAGTSLCDDLQQQIEAGQVVAIVGAGVSVGATNNHAVASWQGLLHHGVDYCRELPTTSVTDAMAQLLHAQIDAGDLDLMLAAAEVTSAKLGSPNGGDWRRWLRETVGELRAQQRDVLEALRDLGVILATTNYDGLIEEVTGLSAVTWRDGALLQWSAKVFAGSEYRHFRLARDGDVASLQVQHPAEQRVFVLGYGPDHNSLAAMLRRGPN